MQLNNVARLGACAALLVVLAGCGPSRPEPVPPRVSHPEVPFAAAQLSTDWEPAAPQPVRTHSGAGEGGGRYINEGPGPVLPPAPSMSPSRLAELLPPPPKGWWAEQANVETSVVNDRTHYQTMAQRSYAKAWAPSAPSVSLAIRVDWGAGDTLKAELDARCAGFGAACREVTTTQGNGRAVEVEATHSSELAVLVQPNLVVQAWGQGVSAAELQAWLERIPADRLAGLVLPPQ